MQEIYLGDGLYASTDGFQIQLRAPREQGDHVIYLEPAVFQTLLKAARSWGMNVSRK